MKQLTAFITVFMLATAAAAFAPAAGAETEQKPHHRHFVGKPVDSNRVAGTGVDNNGWRHRDNARGWDNTCLNLAYLPSEFACDAK
jgi:hypothetical protein